MSTDATRCKVCGGPFGDKRIIIEGQAYHQGCSYMSYPSHTHEDYSRLSDQFSEALGIMYDLLGLEPGSSERAMKFIDDHSPTAAEVKGILPLPSSERGSNALDKPTSD